MPNTQRLIELTGKTIANIAMALTPEGPGIKFEFTDGTDYVIVSAQTELARHAEQNS